MDDFEPQDLNCMAVNYEKVMADEGFLSVTKLLINRIKTEPYILVGEYIKGLSSGDLQALLDSMEDSHERQLEDLTVISETLALCEGCPPSENEQDILDRVQQLTVLLLMESLHRRGLIKLYHENMSFHPDMHSKILAEKIEGLDYDGLA